MQFEILGEIWNVEFVPPNAKILLMPNTRTYTIGCCDRRTNTIYLTDTLYGEKLREVLQHELCHALHYASGGTMNLMNEECMCDFIGKYADEITEITEKILYGYDT